MPSRSYVAKNLAGGGGGSNPQASDPFVYMNMEISYNSSLTDSKEQVFAFEWETNPVSSLSALVSF